MLLGFTTERSTHCFKRLWSDFSPHCSPKTASLHSHPQPLTHLFSLTALAHAQSFLIWWYYLILLPTCFILKSSLLLSKHSNASSCSNLSGIPDFLKDSFSSSYPDVWMALDFHHCSTSTSTDTPSFDEFLPCSGFSYHSSGR